MSQRATTFFVSLGGIIGGIGLADLIWKPDWSLKINGGTKKSDTIQEERSNL